MSLILPDSRIEVPQLLIPGVAPVRRCRMDHGHSLAADNFYLFGPNGGQDLGRAGMDVSLPSTQEQSAEGWESDGSAVNCGSWGPADLSEGSLIWQYQPFNNWNTRIQNLIVQAFGGGNFYIRWITSDGGNWAASIRGAYTTTITLYYDPASANNTKYRKDRVIGISWKYDEGATFFEAGERKTSTTSTTGKGLLAAVTEPNVFSVMDGLFRSFQRFERRLSDEEMCKLTADPYQALIPE